MRLNSLPRQENYNTGRTKFTFFGVQSHFNIPGKAKLLYRLGLHVSQVENF